MVKSFGKIHISLSLLFAPKRMKRSSSLPLNYLLEHPLDSAKEEPCDVMRKGHFVVIAKKGEETKRFVIELFYLTKPEFLGLLELAKEEYGFEQEGALVIPCYPQELEEILGAIKECARDGCCFGSKLGLVHRKLMCICNVFASLVKGWV